MGLRMSTKIGVRIIVIFTILLLGVFATLDYMAPAGRRLAKVKGEDPVNYFGTAHSMLFDHDFNLNNEYEHMPPDGRFWTLGQPSTGLPGSPWGLGYSFLSMPLLALGTGVDALTGHPADGYSQWAIYFYCVGSLIFTGCGMVALFLLLQSVAAYWKILPEEHQSIYALFVTFAVFFGTSVGYYAFSEMAHAATFLCASVFLLLWWRERESESAGGWLVLGLAGGFLSITRWQDVLYLAGPLLFDLGGGLAILARASWWRSRLLYAAGIGLCWAPQIFQWKMIYGKYITIPQGGGIFSFPPQHMMQVLFSSQNGFFIWTPLTLLGIAGLVMGAFKATRIYLPWIIVFLLQAMVVGAVSFWSGVESFGARYMLSNTPLVGFGLITAYGMSGVWVRRTLSAAAAVCCIFTSLFAIQFRLDLVPTETRLTSSELFYDKIHLVGVRQRKASTKLAVAALKEGNPEEAIRILEPLRSLGEDRNVEMYLEKAYRAAGKTEQADAAGRRFKQIIASEYF